EPLRHGVDGVVLGHGDVVDPVAGHPGIWRHVVRRHRLRYDPLYWGLVFPLGMYSTCTFRLSELLEAPFLWWIAAVFVVAATVAWLLTFLGAARRRLELWVLFLGPSGVACTEARVSAELWRTGGTPG